MKILKIAAIVFGSLLALAGMAVYVGVNWVNENLESLINANPDRTYDINFEEVDFNYIRRVIFIEEVKISPVGGKKGVFVDGRVEQVALNKLNLWRLFLHQELVLEELVFVEPLLVVYVPEENPDKERAGEGLKNLFGDILSRGKIENFELGQASVQLMKNGDQIGTLNNLNILASELETDSLKWEKPIPFDYGRIFISIDGMDHELPNSQRFSVGKVEFDTRTQELTLVGLSLKFPDGFKAASSQMEYQIDLIEFELDSMRFSGLEANSNLYSDPDVRAGKLELSGLVLKDFRDKNLPRPHDDIKPLFQGMVMKIPFPLKLDTLSVLHSSVIYSEAVPDSDEIWEFHLDHLNGQFVNITSIPEYQSRLNLFEGDFTAKINGAGSMVIDFDIPYSRDEFDLNVELTDFPLSKINEILNPIMNGEIISGDLHRLSLHMQADSMKATNKFVFDYTDLKFNLFKKESQEKNKVMSTVANILLKESNMPGENNYTLPEYSTERNRLRGPFHLIWNGTKEGMLLTIPGGAAQTILNPAKK
ncbi:hypothetical protein GCM10009119_20500 [Algoriphagus jejuensis]|uniref:AsmA-like protein n=1 Tax=Algoriphagus jejuensis TaxID=419934 RepID=A0ABN1N0I5_9BACT